MRSFVGWSLICLLHPPVCTRKVEKTNPRVSRGLHTHTHTHTKPCGTVEIRNHVLKAKTGFIWGSAFNNLTNTCLSGVPADAMRLVSPELAVIAATIWPREEWNLKPETKTSKWYGAPTSTCHEHPVCLPNLTIIWNQALQPQNIERNISIYAVLPKNNICWCVLYPYPSQLLSFNETIHRVQPNGLLKLPWPCRWSLEIDWVKVSPSRPFTLAWHSTIYITYTVACGNSQLTTYIYSSVDEKQVARRVSRRT